MRPVIDVERVDYIRVPVTDMERPTTSTARCWASSGIRTRQATTGSSTRSGNVTLAVMTPHTHDYEFTPLPPSTIALRVPTSQRPRSKLESAGLEVGEMWDSGACHGVGVSDPAGNRILLHRRYAPYPDGSHSMIDVERTDFVGIPVTDRARAVEFYGETLGLKRNPLAHEEWPEFETGNVTILLNTPEQTGVPFSPSNTAVALRVADVAEAMEKLREKGVEFLFPEAYDSGVCHMAFFKDPDGNSLILHHRHAPYSDGSKP